ncbi:DgyrCDS9891 [Dimorphilus gyrociliatus]|uniref:GTP cyclohydrolase 1 feedback regulatory protein n=1 Tax=Dimorphilus gyrociliatus TaxID=2664684 RepID=A0A7I8W127_9ANNE|nr:DgyrCDS9891 [Dimorphilus gyrociliatus]
MPYVVISTKVRLESGPCTVGDADSDKELMEYLDATLTKKSGNNFYEYETRYVPRMVLNMLEQRGYYVVAMTGVARDFRCIVGDESSDSNMMGYLDAELVLIPVEGGRSRRLYLTRDSPCQIMNKLERRNYHVIAATGYGQTCTWTLYSNCDKIVPNGHFRVFQSYC